jgi:hypothetical protein
MISSQKTGILLVVILLYMLAGSCELLSKVYSDKPLIIGDSPEDEVFEINSKTEFYHTGGILVKGKGVLLVKGTLYQVGNIYVTETGSMVVDGGRLHLDGNDTNVYVDEEGSLTFNDALLHYVQQYVGQHNLIAGNDGRISFSRSRVDCDGSIEFVHLADNASYEAVNTVFADWTTWYLHHETSLFLEEVNYAGDIVFYDSPTLTFKNTNVIMLWLYFGDGAVMDYEFPSESTSVTVTIDDTLPGVSGIPWRLTIEDCSYVTWGVNPYPGSDITVRDSQLTMALFRFSGQGTFTLEGIMRNNSYYKDEYIPVTDRRFRLVNTSVKWWKVDVIDDFQLRADSIVFSEMVLKNNSKAYLTNSVCEGQTIHLGAKDNAFVSFEKGEVWSYVSVWNNACMVLRDSVVDWEKGKFIYQTSNIAHGNSRLYCLNSMVKSKPRAYDSALVMFAYIVSPAHNKQGGIPIHGSAWIDAGPESDVTFSCYQLSWSKNSTDWILITDSGTPVEDGILGVWDTAGLLGGEYTLQLRIWVDNDHSIYPPDQYPVYRTVILPLNGFYSVCHGCRKIKRV